MGQANIYNKNTKDFNINELIRSYYVYAKDNINPGDFVEFVNGVSKKSVVTSTDTVISSSNSAGLRFSSSILDSNRVFIAYGKNDDKYLYGVVCTINKGVITVGTETLLSTTTYGYYHKSVATLSKDKVFIAYFGNSGSYPYAMVCTINGTTITKGTETQLLTTNTSVNCEFDTLVLSDGKVFVIYGYSTNEYLHGMICTVSGTTITKGTDTSISTHDEINGHMYLIQLDSGKILIIFGGDGGYIGPRGRVATVSGTTFTLGAQTEISSIWTGYGLSATKLKDGDKVFISSGYGDESSERFLYGIVCTVSDTTITKGTYTQLSTVKQTGLETSSITLPDGKIFIAHRYVGDAGSYMLYGMICSISGTTITKGTDTQLSPDNYDGYHINNLLLDDKTIFISHTAGSSYPLNAQLFSIENNVPVNKVTVTEYEKQVKKAVMSGKFNGIARSNGSGGDDTAHNQQVEVGVIGNLFNTTDKSWSLSGVAIKVTNNVMTVTGTCTGATGKVTLADNLNLPKGNYRVHFKGACNGTFEIVNKAGTIMYWGAGNKVYVVDGKDINKIVYYTQTTGAYNVTVEFAIYRDDDLEDRNNDCYIESTGTQYIDGISLSSNFRFEFDVVLYKTTAYYNLYDGGSGTGNMLWITGDNSPAGANKLELNTNATKVDITMGTRHNIVVDNSTSCVVSVDGVVKQTLTKVSNNLNFSLFNRAGSQCFKGKIYGLKIYDNNTLVRDFVPAINSSGVPCMYDRVSKTYFLNKGTGTFKFGTNKQPYQYLESSGTQYIDTGIVPNSKTRMEVRFKLTKTDVKHNMGWGSSGSQEAFMLALSPDVGFRTGVSSSYQIKVAKSTLDTNIHTFDIKSGSQKFDGVEYATDTIGDTAETGQTLYLFGLHAEWSTTVDEPCYMQIYTCRIYDGDSLVRDFVPANPNGTPCLYDKISKRYFYNKGTGSFVIK